MIPEREREALMRLTMCAREECSMCKYQGDCNFDFQYELATKNMNILADALNADRKTEPQYDFGEYADRLWKIAYERGKREALEQTEPSCETCILKDTTEWCKRQDVCRAYQPKTENSSEIPNNSTISKMEQVDKDINVRSKDESQTERSE